MGITSFAFLCFFAAMLVLYYIIPKRMQWSFLLACSVVYYLLSGNGFLILYPVMSVTVCWLGTYMLDRIPGTEGKKRKTVLALTILANITVLIVLKYVNFGIYTINGIAALSGGRKELIDSVNFLIPLGVSFYTF